MKVFEESKVQLRFRVNFIGSQRGSFAVRGPCINEYDVLRCGEFREASFGSPPIVIGMIVELACGGLEHFIWPGPDGPSLSQVKVRKRLRVLAFPDMLGDNARGAPNFYRKVVVNEARVWCIERDARSQLIDGLHIFDFCGNRATKQERGMRLVHVEGEYDVV